MSIRYLPPVTQEMDVGPMTYFSLSSHDNLQYPPIVVLQCRADGEETCDKNKFYGYLFNVGPGSILCYFPRLK